jgi:hypothetical protein
MTLLTDSTWWQLSIFVVVLCLSILCLVYLTVKLISKTKLGFSIGKLTVNSQSESDVSNHIHCVRSNDFMIVTQMSMDTAKRVLSIERFDTIGEQMSYAEQCLSNLRQHLRSSFLSLLKEVKHLDQVDGLISLHETQDYMNVLRILTFELKDAIRSIYQENHLADMTDVEFEAYTIKRVQFLGDLLTEILDETYPSGACPSRERVFESNKKTIHDINQHFEDMIRRGRIIAISKRQLVDSLESTLNSKLKEIIG